jgi:hypothetical protein
MTNLKGEHMRPHDILNPRPEEQGRDHGGLIRMNGMHECAGGNMLEVEMTGNGE